MISNPLQKQPSDCVLFRCFNVAWMRSMLVLRRKKISLQYLDRCPSKFDAFQKGPPTGARRVTVMISGDRFLDFRNIKRWPPPKGKTTELFMWHMQATLFTLVGGCRGEYIRWAKPAFQYPLQIDTSFLPCFQSPAPLQNGWENSDPSWSRVAEIRVTKFCDAALFLVRLTWSYGLSCEVHKEVI